MFAEGEILLFIFNLLFLLQSRNKYIYCNSELKGVHKKQVRSGSMYPCHSGSVAKECDALPYTSLGPT